MFKPLYILLSTLLIIQDAKTSLPASYQTLSGREKQDHIWAEISTVSYDFNKLPREGPSFLAIAAQLVPSYLTKSFTHVSDEMPEGRKKILHPFGTAAKVDFHIYDNSTYTGIFRPGNYPGLVRASLGIMNEHNFVPGMALKVRNNII